MGVITYDHEVTSSVPPAKLFKAFILDFDNLIPKILPQAIKSVETLQGDGGAGTVKLTHFGEGQYVVPPALPIIIIIIIMQHMHKYSFNSIELQIYYSY